MPPPGYPLSFAQQRLWFLNQLSPEHAHYNVPLVFDVEGPVDLDVLRRALDELVRRHEPLRTVFTDREGIPEQCVLAHEPFDLPVEDLSHLPADARGPAVQPLIDREVRRPFDLNTGPIFRAAIVRLSAQHHVLIAVVHHIAFDAWSSGVLFRELAAIYGAFSEGRPSPLPEVSMRYVDFAAQQRAWLTGETFTRQMAYWREQLRPPRPMLKWPMDRPRPAVPTHKGHRAEAFLSQSAVQALQDLGRAEGVTPFMTYAAAYAVLLHRLSGQDDVIIGTPIANRTRQELEPLIGFFINSLALRIDLSGPLTFRELLGRTRRVAIEAYANQELPFERLVEELNPDRSLAQMPLVQTFLVLDGTHAGSQSIAVGDVIMRRRVVTTGTAKFDVQLGVWRAPAGRRVVIDTSADLFDPDTSERMLRQFCHLAEHLAEHVDDRLERLPLWSRSDRRVWAESSKCTVAPIGGDHTLVDLFSAQVRLTPDADAVVCGNRRVSYGELDARANQLASVLIAGNIGPDDRVGLCLERSPDLIAAALAVLKAGGAYVPLDPQYPEQRLRFIAQDAGCRLVITQRELLPLAEAFGVELLAIDGLDSALTAGPQHDAATASSLAYVIYTSGSTGTPKGVAIEHRQVVNLVTWAIATFAPEERAGMLASTSMSFDLSVFEWFVPLCSGGTVILVENLLVLPRSPERHRVTFVNSVPSVVRELLRADALPPSVTVVAMAGEPLPTSLVAQVYQQPSVKKVFDLYGPTETTVYATCALRTADGLATIGRPIANTFALVLDEQRELTPPGVAGELFIGGAGVGRGYLGREELTCERFLVDPAPDLPCGRMYRTGDRVRWRNDGTLEFLGRTDRQVKLRGLRIELGEIDAALSDHADVLQAVVLKREASSESAHLVAYIVERHPCDDDSVYRHLEPRLPHYMLPARLVRVPALPRLPNGKLDVSALERLTERVAVTQAALIEERAARSPMPRMVSVGVDDALSWAGVSTTYPRDSSVSALFESRAAANPTAVAIVSDHAVLTYGELNTRANQLSHRLSEVLPRPGPVGIGLPRSVDAIVAMLAILKSGRAYVPLEPSWPSARLRELSARSGVTAVITRTVHSGQFVSETVFDLDAEADAIEKAPMTDLADPPGAESLAYVLFTSGTTGAPKAVGVPHRAIVRLAYGLPDVPLGPDQTVMQLAPLSFDASTFEIWCPLLQGARIAVAPDDVMTTTALGVFLTAHKVTTVWLTASLFNAVIDDDPHVLRGVQCVVTGGEALSVPHVRRALAALPGVRLINGYGPTEATTFACSHLIDEAAFSDGQSVPIGRPLFNTRVYVLNEQRQLVAPGQEGELWIGGDGLAVGYLDDAALTAERFTTDPFIPDAGARIYRTGDRARWRSAGTLEFLGRLDDQIKLRGFRIEPGEVEAALAEHATVQRVAVVARELPSIGRALMAFVVLDRSRSHSDDDTLVFHGLRDDLRMRLPEYMVPSQWIAVDALPLLPTGKVDRRALTARDLTSQRHVGTAAVEPKSDIQTRVANILCALLGLQSIGIHDTFFDLGGHSLLATQAVSRIRSAFGVDVDLRTFFTKPTVAALAAAIERLGPSPAVNPIASVPRREKMPLSYSQQRIWFLQRWHGDAPVYHVPAALRLEGSLDVDRLIAALQTIVDRHEALRTAFPMIGGTPMQQIASNVRLPLSRIDLSHLDPEAAEVEARALIMVENGKPFDLEIGPPIRVTILHLGPTTAIVLLTLHHIASDGWSLGVLFRELEALYGGGADCPRVLPPVLVQYADFAAWQRRHLSGPLFEQHLTYWREQLKPPVAALEWPLDGPRPDVTGVRGDRIGLVFPADLSRTIARVSAAEVVTPFMILLSAFQAVLHRYTGQHDVLVGTPTANRMRPELEGLIGCFINTLVMRGDLSGDPTFRDLLRRTRQVAIDAQTHQDMPFELLVDALKVKRSASRSPLFQAMLVLNDGPASTPTPSLQGLSVSAYPLTSRVTKFELTLSLRTTSDGLRGSLQYDADLFDRSFAQGIADDISAFLHSALAEPDRPVATVPLVFADARRAARHTATAVESTATTPEPDANAAGYERLLQPLWCHVLDVARVEPTDNFFDLGGHSLLAVRLFADIEQRLRIRLPLSTLFRDGTIRGQACLLAAQAAQPGSWSALVPIRPDGSRPPLFLVHGIGGEVLSFGALAQHLGPDQPVFGLQAEHDVDYVDDRLEAVAARYISAMRSHSPRGPYYIGGYSSGGVVAYEMAQQLLAAGEEIGLLAMVDASAPKITPAPLTAFTLWRMVKNAAYWTLDDEFLRSGWAARRARVSSKLKSIRARAGHKKTVAALDAGADIRDLLGLWKVPARARAFLERYVRMIGAYTPRPYRGIVTVFRARTLSLTYTGEEDLGWGQLARGVAVHHVPGSHDTILKEPRVRELAAALFEQLSESAKAS